MTLVEMGLEVIKKRYFCEPLGEVRHLSGCEIHRVKKPRFCSCGLLYDLNYYFIFSDLAEVIYPDCQKVPDRLFAEDYKKCRDLIVKIFGNRFPGAITRLQGRKP